MPLTPAFMNALHIVDGTTLAPLARGGGGNSTSIPASTSARSALATSTRARRDGGARGERFALGPLLGVRRSGVDGEPYSIITDVPRLSARELAARLRDGQMEGAASSTMVVAENVRALERLLASNEAPMDWHVFVTSMADVEAAGPRVGRRRRRGVLRSRARVSRATAGAGAGRRPRWTSSTARVVELRRGGARSSVLLPLAEQGEHWLSPNLLREGTIAASFGSAMRLARYDVEAAARIARPGRGDLRGELLTASVAAAEAAAAAAGGAAVAPALERQGEARPGSGAAAHAADRSAARRPRGAVSDERDRGSRAARASGAVIDAGW
jgi:hypothetical protein